MVDITYDAQSFTDKLTFEKEKQEKLEKDLVEHYEQLLNAKLEGPAKKDLIESFISYILDKGTSDRYTAVISSYVVKRSNDKAFVNSLNQIKEGLVLLTGLMYTDDLINIGKWNDELTIYLDTEHLFNSAGYNGELYERLFDDFYNLVKEINVIGQNTSQKKLIRLKYFDSVKEEIDNFFFVAEKIIKREDISSPENTAMEQICKGCSNVSDILRKKTDFESHLQTRGIVLQKEPDYYNRPEFNVEDKLLLEKYKNDFKEEDRSSCHAIIYKNQLFKKGHQSGTL